jgi:hypothetical protein
MTSKDPTKCKLTWELKVPIFKNPIILKQLGIAFGLPFGILIIILLAITQEIRYLFYFLMLIGFLFLLTYLAILVLYKGRYDVGFVIDDKGIRCYTQKAQAKKNKMINSLACIAGIALGKPGVAGAGLLAQSRQDETIKWKNIKKVKYKPKHNMMLIKGNFAENIAVFCTKDNYEKVKSEIDKRTIKE